MGYNCFSISFPLQSDQEEINYYDFSFLQFLSMKLATLIPDLSIDLERALAKEVSPEQYT